MSEQVTNSQVETSSASNADLATKPTTVPAPVQDTTTDQQPTAIGVSQFNAYYEEFHAVHNLSMDIPSKRVTALIGPSGCGKSTLLRWLNRMNDTIPGARAEGKIVVDGHNLLERHVDVVDLRRRIGMVFQRPNPFPKSIYDNVAFGPRLHHKLTKTETDELIEACLQKAALWDEVKDRLNSSALGLSGGQQQRLCIARAIATGPEILLMDEPCSALDPASTLAIEDLISELREDFTIVIVTHNMQQARRVSDKTAFMFTGDLIEYGGTSKLFTTPREQQTADYIQGKFG